MSDAYENMYHYGSITTNSSTDKNEIGGVGVGCVGGALSAAGTSDDC